MSEVRRLCDKYSDGESIADLDELRLLLSQLEWYLPGLFAEVHVEWNDESLDGIYPEIVRKIDVRALEVGGWCIFIRDQALTPIHVKLQIAPADDAISWLECKIGQRDGVGMLKQPYRSQPALFTNFSRWDSIEWVYHIGFGERVVEADG